MACRLCLVDLCHVELFHALMCRLSILNSGRYEPARQEDLREVPAPAAVQLHAIVKSVYAMLHRDFDDILRGAHIYAAPALWEAEWAGDTGALWTSMAAGDHPERMSKHCRGGVVVVKE